jgi:electron transport complex protein RnfG
MILNIYYLEIVREVVMKKVLLLTILLLCLSLSGCQKDVGDLNIPEQFFTMIDTYDGQYQNRESTYETEDVYRCYQLDDQQYYFITKTDGYKEDMLIGVLVKSESVLNVDIIYENESDKYGEYVTEDWFLERFVMDVSNEMVLVKMKKEHDNEVVAITGATMSSQGVLDAVNKCISIMEEKK